MAPETPRNPALWIGAICLYIVATLLVYIPRMPWRQEEPRRAIVAQEMLLTGRYLHPTVCQRPYYQKPPLHNWAIALASHDRRITHTGARMVSVTAFVILAVSVGGLLRRDRRMALTGFAITATSFLMLCEHSRLAEPDMLLALFTFLAYALYIRDPFRNLNLVGSALFAGLGILTKGVTPLFFYPGLILFSLTRDRRGERLLRLGAHLLLACIPAALWLAALHFEGRGQKLLATSGHEIAIKVAGDLGEHLKRFVAFPLRAAVMTLPWSLILALGFRRSRERSDLRDSSLWIAGISLLCLSLAAGSRDRYILPAIPFFAVFAAHHLDWGRAVSCRISIPIFIALGVGSVGWGIYFVAENQALRAAAMLVPAAAASAAAARRWRLVPLGIGAALVFFSSYMHGWYSQRIDALLDERKIAGEIAVHITDGRPILTDPESRLLRTVTYLEGLVERVVYDAQVFHFPDYYLVANDTHLDPTGNILTRVPFGRHGIREVVLQEVTAARAD